MPFHVPVRFTVSDSMCFPICLTDISRISGPVLYLFMYLRSAFGFGNRTEKQSPPEFSSSFRSVQQTDSTPKDLCSFRRQRPETEVPKTGTTRHQFVEYFLYVSRCLLRRSLVSESPVIVTDCSRSFRTPANSYIHVPNVGIGIPTIPCSSRCLFPVRRFCCGFVWFCRCPVVVRITVLKVVQWN